MVQVKATGGDTRLGGEDFDQSLLDWAAKECEKKHGVDPRKTARSARRLQTACERAKRMLSSATSSMIEVHASPSCCLLCCLFPSVQTFVKDTSLAACSTCGCPASPLPA